MRTCGDESGNLGYLGIFAADAGARGDGGTPLQIPIINPLSPFPADPPHFEATRVPLMRRFLTPYGRMLSDFHTNGTVPCPPRRFFTGYDVIQGSHAEMPPFTTSYEDLTQRCPLL
jgi:hypothetical protein